MDDVRLPEPSTQVDAPPKRGKATAFVLLGLFFAAAAAAGAYFYVQGMGIEATDDAFVDGHVSQVSPQVAGRVVALLVADNQLVAAGQEVLRLDPQPFAVKLDQARASYAQAEAQLAQARATLAIRRTDLGQAQANQHVAEADLFQAQSDLTRYRAINPRAITKQQLDNATATQRSASARVEVARQAEAGMRAQIVAAQASIDAAQAAVQAAAATMADAKLQLSYTHVLAPAAGQVTRRTVELGNYITPGQALLAVVQKPLWVTANFKETQLARMRPGQAVALYIDAFPAARLTGHVDSFQAGTGAQFSAIPVENATGNYVKVVQRLPVKILFDGDAASRLALAPGMSVTPRVTVR